VLRMVNKPASRMRSQQEKQIAVFLDMMQKYITQPADYTIAHEIRWLI